MGAAIGGALTGVVALVLFSTGDAPGRYSAFTDTRSKTKVSLGWDRIGLSFGF